MSTIPTLIAALRRASGIEGALPPVPVWEPVRNVLATTQELSPFELDLVCLSVLPELHEAWGDLFAQMGSAWRRPTLGLALRILVPDLEQGAQASPRLARGAAMRQGWVRLGLPDLPQPDRPLLPNAVVVAALHGQLPPTLSNAGRVRPMPSGDGDLLLAARPSLAAVVARLADAPLVQLGRATLDGGRELALALAAQRGLPLVRVHNATSGEATLQDAMALATLGPRIVLLEAAPESRLWVFETAPARGAVVLSAGDARVEAPSELALRVVDVPYPTPPEAAALWRSLVPSLPKGKGLDLLSNQTRLPMSAMRAAASAAEEPTPRAIQHALRAAQTDPPSTLARVSRPTSTWDALVVPQAVRDQLQELESRVTHRVTVQYRWGMSTENGRGDGVIGLLHGDSGVGKTFACEVLASELGLPLVKVDLSRVVSKYIGETEKNLESVFDLAEGFGVVLLFDEADAVFGKRTGVRDAHDRYANIETNYLLQRLEAFEGIAVLSTNLLKNIDEAFLRRLQLVVHLPRPTVALRQRLWERNVPTAVCSPDVDLEALARRFDLVGAEIQNAAVRAAYGAVHEGQDLSQAALTDAVRVEFAKKGRPFPGA